MAKLMKRISKELQNLEKDPLPNCIVKINDDNLYDWRFIFKGEKDSPYHNGIYMGKIRLPDNYPLKPPKISVITPNGRFEPGKDICLSITNFHPESWNPGWGVRSIIIGLISFFYDNENTHGAIRTTEKDKIKLAKESIIFNKKNKEYIKLFNDNELEK